MPHAPLSLLLSESLKQSLEAKHINQDDFKSSFISVLDLMRAEFGAVPAGNDWVRIDKEEYFISARTFVLKGKSGGPELWIAVEPAPEESE